MSKLRCIRTARFCAQAPQSGQAPPVWERVSVAPQPPCQAPGPWAPAKQGRGGQFPGECVWHGPFWVPQAGSSPGGPCLPWPLVPAGWASGGGQGPGAAPRTLAPRVQHHEAPRPISGVRGFMWRKRLFGTQRTPLSGPGPVQEELQNHVHPQVGGARAAPCGDTFGGAGPDFPGGSSPPHTQSHMAPSQATVCGEEIACLCVFVCGWSRPAGDTGLSRFDTPVKSLIAPFSFSAPK